MKKKNSKTAFLLACAILAASPAESALAAVQPADLVSTETSVDTAYEDVSYVGAARSKTPKKGWYTTKSGKKKFYRNGKYITGPQKIGKYKYYFFSKKTGTMLTKNVTYKGVYYYIDKNTGRILARRKGSRYYNANGTRMSYDEMQAFTADENAKRIVAQITNSSMSQEQKLQTCFNWVIRKYYAIWRDFNQGGENWPATFANDHFVYGKGDCVSDASAFAYLAKALGYKNVYVCADANRSNNNAHSWTEIGGLVYDPLFAEAKSYSKYYGASYGSYGLYPVLKYKLS